MEIRDLLHRPPVTVRPETTVRDAARTMDRAGVGALLVSEGDRVLGIVTDRDVVLRGVARGERPDARVDSLMTTDVLALDASADADAARRFFRDHAVRRVAVTSAGHLVGLLSLDDLLVRAGREMADLLAPVEADSRSPHHEAGLPAPRGGGHDRPGEARETGAAPGAAARAAGRLRAQPGDRLVVAGRVAGDPGRRGTVVEVRSAAGEPPFLVSWEDTGHVSFVYPGPDARVEPAGAAAGTTT